MNEIKVGMYFKRIGIHKILTFHEVDPKIYELEYSVNVGIKVDYMEFNIKDIPDCLKTATFNLIDLIQDGDYVNGKRVTDVSENGEFGLAIEVENGHYECLIYQEDIKSVVTKEQFEQMMFMVEGEKEWKK